MRVWRCSCWSRRRSRSSTKVVPISSLPSAAAGGLGEVVEEPGEGCGGRCSCSPGASARHPQLPAPCSQPSCLCLGGEAAQECQAASDVELAEQADRRGEVGCSTANSWLRTAIRCPTRSWRAGPTTITITAQDHTAHHTMCRPLTTSAPNSLVERSRSRLDVTSSAWRGPVCAVLAGRSPNCSSTRAADEVGQPVIAGAAGRATRRL